MPRSPAESPLNRRQFLGSSAKNAAGVAAGMVGLAATTTLAAGALTSGSAPPVRLAIIGIRNQGKELANGFASLAGARVTALCDVDESLFAAVGKSVETIQGVAPRVERDYRRLLDDPEIDAVVIATPDHWHAVMAVTACQAGKDVYLEMPVSHTLHEGQAILEAGHQYQRVIQSGLQQRGGHHFQTAIDYLKSGNLGRVHFAKAWTAHLRKSIGRKADCPAPQGVDYNLWLGPAPERSFNPNRFHHNWHWYWDYGAGELGNWGVHMLDMARWGLGVDWPSQVSAIGGKHYFDDDQQTPDTLNVTYGFPGKSISWEHRLWSHHGIEGRSAAVAFHGDRGTLIVDRGGWKVYGSNDAASSDGSNCLIAHLNEFLNSIRTRQPPAAAMEVGHISSAYCHLGNIAYRVGRNLQFDPQHQRFVNDSQADSYLSKPYRKPFILPDVRAESQHSSDLT